MIVVIGENPPSPRMRPLPTLDNGLFALLLASMKDRLEKDRRMFGVVGEDPITVHE
jgi:hypothetical protein